MKKIYFKKKTNNKNYCIKLEIELNKENVFSCCGTVYLNGIADYCGQCLDEIKEIIPYSKKFAKIYRLWKLYHLNDMHAGTRRQEKALHDAGLFAFANEYEKCCDYLKSINLYEDNGYKFGTKWLKHEIPEKDLLKIKKLLEA